MCCRDGDCCKYKGNCIHNLGWTLIVLGVIGFILAVIADGVYAGYPFATLHHISTPIWGGVFIIIPGGLAVCGGKNPDNVCKRIALLVMSIIGIVFAMLIWIMAAVGLGVDGSSCDEFLLGTCSDGDQDPITGFYRYCIYHQYWYDLYPDWRSIDCGGIKALHALQLLLGLAETVVMFIVSIRCCCGTCCKGTSQQPQTHAMIYQPGQPVPQQQYPGMVAMQPAATAPPVQPSAGQPAYNPQVQSYTSPQPGPYPAQPQPGPYPAQPGPYPAQPGPYPAYPAQYPAQPGAYAAQPGQYPAGPYPSQAGQYPSPPIQMEEPPPYEEKK